MEVNFTKSRAYKKLEQELQNQKIKDETVL